MMELTGNYIIIYSSLRYALNVSAIESRVIFISD